MSRSWRHGVRLVALSLSPETSPDGRGDGKAQDTAAAQVLLWQVAKGIPITNARRGPRLGKWFLEMRPPWASGVEG